MSIKLLLTAAITVIFAGTACGQQKTEPPKAGPALVKGTPPTAAALKAAEEMMVASGASGQFDQTITAKVQQMSLDVPEAKRTAFLKATEAFAAKYCSWAALKDDFCMMYAREFTETELKQLAAFYRSAVGVKLLQKSPLIMQTGALLGQKAMIDHREEMDKIMAEAMK